MPKRSASLLQVCSIITSFNESPNMNDGNIKYLIEENSMCPSDEYQNQFESFLDALVEMFLVSQGAHYGIQIEYPSCGVYGEQMNLQRYVSDWMIQKLESVNNVPLEHLKALCNGMANLEMTGTFSSSKTTFPSVDNIDSRMIGIDVFAETTREFFDKDRIGINSATVYLPCSNEMCTDSSVMPNYFYLTKISSSVKRINFAVEEGCLSVKICSFYVDSFLQFLKQAYPRAEVSFLSGSSTSPEIVNSILFSENVIVNPIGRKMFPIALIREVLSLHIDNVKNGLKTNLIQGQMQSSEFKDILSPFKEASQVTSSSSRDYLVLSEYNDIDSVEELSLLLRKPPTTRAECKYIRGRLGHWVKDLHYAGLAQYKSQLRHYSGQSEIHFKRKADKGISVEQYRPSTSYRWSDEFDNSPSNSEKLLHCPFELVTLNDFCSLLHQGNIGKVFFLGDSLMLQHAQSLWKLLGQDEQPTILHSLEPNFKHSISCPATFKKDGNLFTFDFQFIRNDKLIESALPVSIDSGTMNCGKSYCYPWFREYSENMNLRTLVIANFGPHIAFDDKSDELFEQLFNDFVTNLDMLNESFGDERRGKDIVYFRTSVPGHFG
jgi:hypothetical protein